MSPRVRLYPAAQVGWDSDSIGHGSALIENLARRAAWFELRQNALTTLRGREED